ncbi:MAG: helix-turn-helix transcriptional regulator [Bacteroidia bacterium]
MQELNRIKEVLKVNGIKHSWLADQLEVSSTTVSNWCSNKSQPSLEMLRRISEKLKVKTSDLIKEN